MACRSHGTFGRISAVKTQGTFFSRCINTGNASKNQISKGFYFFEQVMDVPKRGWVHVRTLHAYRLKNVRINLKKFLPWTVHANFLENFFKIKALLFERNQNYYKRPTIKWRKSGFNILQVMFSSKWRLKTDPSDLHDQRGNHTAVSVQTACLQMLVASLLSQQPLYILNKATVFRMEDRGDVISIKFSYDLKVLAVQRSKTSVVSCALIHERI